jgi:hypothetical protein
MATYKRRCRQFFGKIAQPLDRFIGFLPFGSDQRIIPLGFKIKNPNMFNVPGKGDL